MELGEINFINILEEICEANEDVIKLACKYRSKFEGWLKFEIARRLINKGYTVIPEGEGFDILVSEAQKEQVIEFKTVNMNYRISGIETKTRPVTMNFNSVESDVRKIKSKSKVGKVVFVVFPLPKEDERFASYIERIQDNTNVAINHKFLTIGSNYGIVLCESELIRS
jgi:hypothetical protein